MILGHEGAGVVERIGDKVKIVKRGDHVVLSYQSCGYCIQCRNGHQAHCDHFGDANFTFQRLVAVMRCRKAAFSGTSLGSLLSLHILFQQNATLLRFSQNCL